MNASRSLLLILPLLGRPLPAQEHPCEQAPGLLPVAIEPLAIHHEQEDLLPMAIQMDSILRSALIAGSIPVFVLDLSKNRYVGEGGGQSVCGAGSLVSGLLIRTWDRRLAIQLTAVSVLPKPGYLVRSSFQTTADSVLGKTETFVHNLIARLEAP